MDIHIIYNAVLSKKDICLVKRIISWKRNGFFVSFELFGSDVEENGSIEMERVIPFI